MCSPSAVNKIKLCFRLYFILILLKENCFSSGIDSKDVWGRDKNYFDYQRLFLDYF
jgi:hypothetical protein